MDTRRQHSE